MKITIIKNKKPKEQICEMVCDKPLSEHLDKYEITKFMNKHSINLIIGRPGSGKSSFLWAMFNGGGKNKIFKKVFNNIYLFMPENSRQSMKNNIFDKLPEEKKYNELNFENLNEVLTKIKSAEPDEKHAIIFDDMGSYLKNSDVKQLFKELVYNRRHLHTSIFFLVQSWLSLEKDLRKLFTNLIIFKISRSEMDNLINEVIEQKKEHILDIMKIAYDKPHQWLFINVDSNRIFKMWDEIVIEEESED
jgi:hypothetical protein